MKSTPRVRELLLETSAGFGYTKVVIVLDAGTKKVMAAIDSTGDMYPQPPPEWADVNGRVSLSTWAWPAGSPVVIEYDLNGLRGGTRHCVHGAVALEL